MVLDSLLHHYPSLAGLLAAMLAGGAVYLSTLFLARINLASRVNAMAWLAISTLSVGTTVWGALVLGVLSVPMNSEALVDARWTLTSWLDCILIVGVLLTWISETSRRKHQAAAASTEALASAEALIHQDNLTGLHNRQGLERELTALYDKTISPATPFALMFINLDGFKFVNESLGHDHGDNLLKQASLRLIDLIRHDDIVARVSADEFLILLDGHITVDIANVLAQRVNEAMSQTFVIGNHELNLSCSMGIALGDSATQANELIANAETAMRNAKSAGGSTHCFFEKGMAAANAGQIDMQRDLRLAVGRQELMLYYQPKRHTQSGRSCGVEALLRWKHPSRGMVSPGEFIPIAERFGLISALGAWVIEDASRQIRAWKDQGLRVQVAVNLSVHQLRNPDLEQRIRDAISKHDIDPSLLIFEITESVAMENVEASMRVFEKLASIGVQLSIDDFGTGYSSLSYLSKLPATQLKIDRSFVKELDHDKNARNARAIVEAVIRLSHALDLRVVAEGVETEAQHQVLKDLRCDELQGFLFAKPMPPEAFEQWLAAQDTRTAVEEENEPELEAEPA